MTTHSRPGSLEDVRIAVICALPREFDAAILAFDETWIEDENIRGPTITQYHNHKMGRIGSHIAVLVLLPNIGKVSAATETARLRSIYPGLELAILTGICGGVPRPGTNNEILLGDVVISKSIVQYDMGRQYPGKFTRKDTIDDSLGRANNDIRTLLVVLETQLGLNELQHGVNQNLAHIQQMAIDAKYRTCYTRPSAAEDVLFEPTYSHIHRGHRICHCSDATPCNGAISASCEELQCEVGHQVSRRRLAFENERNLGKVEDITTIPESWIHIGCIGSGDVVMKSGNHRDSVAKEHGLIAFEMEGAGVWDEIPCIVVKGVCDYADSHKNKKWQDFAAAIAASATRALLERYPRRDRLGTADTHYPVHYVIPLEKNRRFIERAGISDLKRMLFDQKSQTVALVGLGGVGKTQIALDIAYWVKDNKTEYSVFWVPALSFASFEQAYTNIAKDLGISSQTESEDVKTSVRQFLSSKEAGPWLLIVDNADDEEILFGSSGNPNGLDKYLPQSDNGITLFTTRSRDLALSVADNSLVELHAMNQDEAESLLGKSLRRQELLQDHDSVLKLLDFLTYLPLAITQASAYLNRNRHITISKYLQLLHGTEQTRISTLSREFLDRTRYPDSRNAIATTWLVSFDRIQRTDSYATDMLYFISRIEPKSIPRSILRCSGSEEDTEYAIGTLCSYAFLVQRDEAQNFDMHSLVHLAARIWAKKQSVEEKIAIDAVKHLSE
ncbi:phosphorylase superfamily protein, partial [Colletotrichum incanum]